MEPQKAIEELGMKEHIIRFTSNLTLFFDGPTAKLSDSIVKVLQEYMCFNVFLPWLLED